MATRTSRLLVVTRHTPMPAHDGAGAYLFDLLSYLAQHGTEVHVAWLQPDGVCVRRGWWIVPADFHSVAQLHLPGAWELGRLRVFPAIWWLPFKARALHRVKSVLQFFHLAPRARVGAAKPRPGRSLSGGQAWSSPPNPGEATFFERVSRRLQPGAVLANYCWLTPLFTLAPRARHLVLTHDVSSHRLPLTGAVRHDLPAHSNPATPEGEAALLSRAGMILAISPEDAAVFREMNPKATVVVTPKSATVHPATSPNIRGRCLFVGGPNLPNAEGLRWFLTDVWPAVRAAQPHAHLHVCGAISDLVTQVPDGVILRGRLADLAPEYAGAEVVLVPLLRGTGVKIKIVEAASHGKACVTTPVGLQGLPSFREAVLVADQATAYAAAVVRLLQEPELRHELGSKLAAAVTAHLSPDTCFGHVQAWLDEKPKQSAVRSFSPAVA